MSDVLSRIQSLERLARQLEPGAEDRESLRQSVIALSGEFLEGVSSGSTFSSATSGANEESLGRVEERGLDVETLLETIQTEVHEPGLNPTSGRFMGFVPGGGLFASSLGDYLAAVGNRYAGVCFPSPGAVKLENRLIRWMARLVGYHPESAGGTLCSGGSVASLTAVVAARDHAGMKPEEFHRSVVYLTEQAHHCIRKALHIAGLGGSPVRMVAMDRGFRMDPDDLARLIAMDRGAGLNPFMIVASAGTTDAGAIDPLSRIAEVAESERIWLHVDAAYGGFFRLCEESPAELTDMYRADSIVMDPHKGLFLPYGAGAVILKDGGLLQESFSREAGYMQDTIGQGQEVSPSDVSIEMTRHFRGLRLWLPLATHGLGAFRAAIEEKLWLARHAYERLQAWEGMETLPEPPDLSIVLFRYTARVGDSDEFNLRVTKAVQDDGRAFFSSTRVNGRVWLRLAILCFRTHLDDVDLVLDIVGEQIARLEGVRE